MQERIVYAVVDQQRLTLYRENGETIFIPQGDVRLPKILEQIMPILKAGGVAEIDLDYPDSFSDFEEKTAGVIRFFKVARSKLSAIFGKTPEDDKLAPPGMFGVPPKPVRPMEEMVAEVMAHAKPTKEIQASNSEPTELVAVVEGKVIPNVDKLQNHIHHANTVNSTQGMQAFLSRIAKTIETRSHSVEDLLRFMEKGDMPVADDGSIIAYKVLNKRNDHYVDCHTGLVKQKLGSVVRVDEALIDRDRRNECSNGLHIARRGYLQHFPGSDCFLVKVAPEDVVTVPHGDANKVRVAAYHIVAHLSSEAFAKVKSNKAMTDNKETRELLAKVIAGNHVGQLEEVRITQQSGRGLVITPLVQGKPVANETSKPSKAHIEAAVAVPEAPTTHETAKVDPREVNKTIKQLPAVREPKTVVQAFTDNSLKGKGSRLADMLTSTLTDLDQKRMAAAQLQALKKSSKKGWDKLGISPAVLKLITEILANQPVVKVSKKTKALSEAFKPKNEAPKPAQNDNKFTERDLEIKRLIGLGWSKAQIGRHFGIHSRSVGRALDKFDS